MKKRVLVYPCGTEIGLEIYRAVYNSIHYELVGGSSTYDHGRFVYEKHIDNLPFITDDSEIDEIEKFNAIAKANNIDYLFPAMDGVIYKFSEFRKHFECEVVAPVFETAYITRSKQRTYQLFQDKLEVPRIYNVADLDLEFPLFIKPDIGQGSKGASKVSSKSELEFNMNKSGTELLLLEYLPGDEFTIDCFTNNEGKLVYAGGRGRKRIKGGISVNTVRENDSTFTEIAEVINSRLKHRGGWFFQLKKSACGRLVLLEVASRIAGTSAYARNIGVNLPLMTLYLYEGNKIDSVISNDYKIVLDRALYNKFSSDIKYSHVYLDYDDTLIVNGKVNIQLVSFLYQCINDETPITLLTKHSGHLIDDLKKRRLSNIFNEVVLLADGDRKYQYIKEKDAIFIDDSYGERIEVYNKLGINVFGIHMIECLIK